MTTKDKQSIYQRLRLLTLSMAITVAGMCSFATTTVMLSSSQVAAAASGPECAILDQGRVTCPTSITGSGCYYKDLGNPNPPGNIANTGFVKAPDCTNGIFQEAAQPQVNTYTDPALVPCKAPTSGSIGHATGETGHCDLVAKYIDPLINVLAASVGVVVTISIVVGGIQYASSAGDPGKAQAAKKRITNALIALIGFFLLYAVLQWLVPGGLLNG